jgi:2-polyprenyl-3-methyl-5-hydroxy-6-metoxy-1,4-benzoquinol methylase
MDCTSIELFADSMFDYIFSSHFLEHVQDPEAVLKEWWKKIKVGGAWSCTCRTRTSTRTSASRARTRTTSTTSCRPTS